MCQTHEKCFWIVERHAENLHAVNCGKRQEKKKQDCSV